MIRRCDAKDFDAVWALINQAARAYEGVIPADRWKEPYMPRQELRREIKAGVEFWGCQEKGELLGVMGMQNVGDMTLVRHAYVRPDRQRRGIGSRLLRHLLRLTERPMLVGTWRAAEWAVRFYEGHGFQRLPPELTRRLLRKYWSIPERQVETSVVLADRRWLEGHAVREGGSVGQ